MTAVDHRSVEGATDTAYSACLFADGRQRFIGILGSDSGGYSSSVSQIVTSGRLAAVLTHYGDKYMVENAAVGVYDLRTGLQVRKLSYVAISNVDCTPCQCDGECTTGADDLVLGADGVSAVHAAIEGPGVAHPTEQVVSHDASGVVVRDRVTPPNGYAVLTGLQLTGDALTWLDAGAPRSVMLTPPPG